VSDSLGPRTPPAAIVDSAFEFTFGQKFAQVKDQPLVKKALHIVYSMGIKAKLNPSTMPLFAQFFDVFMSTQGKRVQSKEVIPIAISCFRLAVKFNENQEGPWVDKVPQVVDGVVRGEISFHQYMYDNLLKSMMDAGMIWHPSDEAEHKMIHQKVQNYVMDIEIELLTLVDFNMDQPNGFDIFSLLLEVITPENRRDILPRVHQLALLRLFHQSQHAPHHFKQSTVYLGCFKHFCLQVGQSQFYEKVRRIIVSQGLVSSAEVENIDYCCQSLQANQSQKAAPESIKSRATRPSALSSLSISVHQCKKDSDDLQTP
jgi:hypothetical protein